MKKLIIISLSILLLFTSCNKSEDGSSSGKKTLYVYNWSYYTPEDVIERFEEEYNCDVILDYFASNEEMFAKLMASGGRSGYDLIFPSADYTEIMINQGMLEELNLNNIPNTKYISPSVLSKADYDSQMRYSVPYFMGAAGIAVHKDIVSSYPHSWSLFANSEYKNRMCMMDDMREVMGDALTYLGYSVNTTDDKELNEAFNLIENEWKPNLTKFDAEGFAKSFATGEYVIAQGYAEAFFEELPESRWSEVDFFIPEEGGPLYIDNMCIPKGARNKELAEAFINYICQPENYASFLDRFHFPASVNPEADKYRTTVPFYSAEELERCELKKDLAGELVKYNTLWEKIRYSN